MPSELLASLGHFVYGTVRRTWAIVGGLIFGALGIVQTFQPDAVASLKVPDWSWVAGLAVVAAISAVATYHELRMRYERPKRPIAPEAAYVREQILQISYGTVQPAVHSLNEALRAAEAVYMVNWPVADDREIVSWGIQGRLVGSHSLAHVSNAATIAMIDSPSNVQETFASGLFDYAIGRQMLNMVCHLFLTKDALAGDTRYQDPQKRGCGELMRRWWEADVKLRSQLTAMSSDAHLSGLRGKLAGHLRDDPHYPNAHFTDALAKFWKRPSDDLLTN